ncbi:MAG: hypothetical protein WC788_00905 [Candidatus Paceibacterota bacterium]|jgi:hypothetical protein
METNDTPFDKPEKITDVSQIKNPQTYFETVYSVFMCPGKSCAKIKKSQL